MPFALFTRIFSVGIKCINGSGNVLVVNTKITHRHLKWRFDYGPYKGLILAA